MPNRRPFSAFVDDPDGWREYWTLDQAIASHQRYQSWLATQCPEPEFDPTQEEPPLDEPRYSSDSESPTDSEYEAYLLAQALVA